MHTFEEKSLTVDLINHFLQNYWLPVYDTVQEGDYIIKDYLYIYGYNVIQCTQSGYLGGKYAQGIITSHTVADRTKTYDELLIKYDLKATLYDEKKTYKIFDQCIYNDCLYSCLIDMIEKEPWNKSHWELLLKNNDYVRTIENHITYSEQVLDSQRSKDFTLKYSDTIILKGMKKIEDDGTETWWDVKLISNDNIESFINLNEAGKVPMSELVETKYIQYIYNSGEKYYQYKAENDANGTLYTAFQQQPELRDLQYNKGLFKILWRYEIGGKYRKFTDSYIPTSHNYTSATHERLGKFVQAYSDLTGIDLRPYYNFNSNRHIDNLYLARYNEDITAQEEIIDTSQSMLLKNSPVVRGAFQSGVTSYGKAIFNDVKITTNGNVVIYADLDADGRVPQEAISQGGIVAYKYTKITYSLYDSRSTKRIAIIPIRFNHTYTVAIDCPGQVLMCPVFLTHQRKLMLTDPSKKTSAEKSEDLTQTFINLTNQIFNFPSMSFSKPEFVEIKCVDDVADRFYKYQKNLYLMIQLPAENTSAITVLEGKYTSTFTQYTEFDVLKNTSSKKTLEKILDQNDAKNLTATQLNKTLISNLSLLQFNLNMQVPFSNRLIEYIFDNVIEYTTDLDQNIAQAQTLLTNASEDELDIGIWTNATRIKMFLEAQKYKKSRHMDLSGNVDREMERILLQSPNNGGRIF